MKFSETVLLSLYVHELYGLAVSVEHHCQFVFDQTPSPPPGQWSINADPIVQSQINAALLAAAGIRRLLDTSTKRRPGESPDQCTLRCERAAMLRHLLVSLELGELEQARLVRNALEHFDERLDKANLRLSENPGPTRRLVAYNIALSDRQAPGQDIWPLRLYVMQERTFYSLECSVDLGRLHDQAAAIAARVRDADVLGEATEPGGLLIAVGGPPSVEPPPHVADTDRLSKGGNHAVGGSGLDQPQRPHA